MSPVASLARSAGNNSYVSRNLKEEVVRVNRSQKPTDLMSALYDKLGEAVELAEELQRVARTKQELRQARRIAKQLTNLRGNATELLYDMENPPT